MRAVLSTGSNIEDSRAHLASVVDEFAAELVAATSGSSRGILATIVPPDPVVRGILEQRDGAVNLLADRIDELRLRAPTRSRNFR